MAIIRFHKWGCRQHTKVMLEKPIKIIWKHFGVNNTVPFSIIQQCIRNERQPWLFHYNFYQTLEFYVIFYFWLPFATQIHRDCYIFIIEKRESRNNNCNNWKKKSFSRGCKLKNNNGTCEKWGWQSFDSIHF